MPAQSELDESTKPMYEAINEVAKVLGGQSPETLDEIAKLDTCVTLVDCKAFSGDVSTCDSLLERYRDQVKEQKSRFSLCLQWP